MVGAGAQSTEVGRGVAEPQAQAVGPCHCGVWGAWKGCQASELQRALNAELYPRQSQGPVPEVSPSCIVHGAQSKLKIRDPCSKMIKDFQTVTAEH